MPEIIGQDIQNALLKLDINYPEDIIVETPKTRDNGDYSSNIALKLKSYLEKTPMEIAQLIVDNLNKDNYESVSIKAPGFINFFVNKNYLLANINNILNLKENYGKSDVGKGIKVNVEFVSANPTGLLHVGTIRGTAYGDNLCRVLTFTGYDVTREYYFNDGGAQIINLGKSLKARYEEVCGLVSNIPEDGYHGQEIVELAQSLYAQHKDSLLKESDAYFAELATTTFMNIIKSILNDFRVSFDVWTSEQDIRRSGNIENCLKILKDEGNLYDEDGATWLKTTKYGDDKDRVLIKSDGSYTYLVPDIAYHLDKIKRGYDSIIDVLGSDHHGYISRLKASIEALGFDQNKIRIKMLQMVKLLRDGQEVKLSKRTGGTVTMQELIDEVGVNAVRYFFASRSLDTQMDFDLNLAIKESNENPVYYVSYAYARICSILRENKITNDNESFTMIKDIKVYDVLEKIYNFPKIVIDAATKELPHLITNYIYELASLFHYLYNEYRFICDDELQTQENLKMLLAIKITMENALNLIGIIPPERM